MTHLNDEQLNAAADDEALDAAVLDHLGACASCRDQVQQLRELRAQLAALPSSINITAEVWPQIRENIRARQRRRRVFVASTTLALAAAVLFAVVRDVPPPDTRPNEAEIAELKGVVAPVVVEAVTANLTVYDIALKELETHAASERENADLQQRIDDLKRKRAALIRLASNS